MEKFDDFSNNDLDKPVEEIQEEIMEEIKKNYSPIVIDHWQNPRNRGIMHDADGHAKITGPCGDTMEISIKIRDQKIIKCTFDTDGCGTTITCASIITEMATGKTIREARQINQKKMLEFCGGLPDESQHCALLSANTLQKALDDYDMIKNEPWRRLYKK